jgi:hypothetical protein
MSGFAQDPDPAAGVLDDRKYEQMHACHGDCLEEIAGEQGAGLEAEEAGPSGGVAFGCWVDPGVVEDLPYGGGGSLNPGDKEFAVDAAIAPARFSRARRSTSRRMEPAEHVAGEPVQQGSQERSVGGGEPRPVRA